ncbi:unnamed protein product [Callosobruchus maculatus]|uniref:Uncharacterized protein n=1 Tax=Callosobruchus maculatus TaxID=64391 RepID=A0A653DLR3_CALMS|nr:unnamed protein product [Callosobruchus maculatus]
MAFISYNLQYYVAISQMTSFILETATLKKTAKCAIMFVIVAVIVATNNFGHNLFQDNKVSKYFLCCKYLNTKVCVDWFRQIYIFRKKKYNFTSRSKNIYQPLLNKCCNERCKEHCFLRCYLIILVRDIVKFIYKFNLGENFRWCQKY